MRTRRRVDSEGGVAHDETVTLDLSLIVAAAALALWTYVRLAARAPLGWWSIAGHLLLSVVVAYTLVPSAMNVLLGMERTAAGVLAVVGVALPALTYMFLASLWLLAVLGRLLQSYAR